MGELAAYRQELFSSMMGVVDELSQIVTAIPPNVWHVASGPAARSPHFILAHLRELEEQVFFPNLQRIQMEELALLAVFDDQAWMTAHYRLDEPLLKIMEEYAQLRAQEVTWLRNLPPEDWSRMARHPWWGLRTFQWWVERQLESSQQHREQLSAFLT